MKSSNVSIVDIAKACGVSAMTVSRALRQSDKVRPETREKILACAEKRGYFKGSRLGRQRTETDARPRRVRLILGGEGDAASIFHSLLVNTIQRELIRHDCECVIYSNDASYNGFLTLLEALKRQSADVTVAIGDFPEPQLKTLLITFPGMLLLDNPGVGGFDATFSSFNFDNRGAALAMMRHLLTERRKKIVLLSGRSEHFFSRALEEAYLKALAEAGIAFDDRMLLRADFTAVGAERAFEEFLKLDIPFDAVFSNDEMAMGVYRSLLRRHIAIPDDVAVAGCDNLPLGRVLFPSLSTVDLDYGKLAAAAVDFILRGEDGVSTCRTLLKAKLLIRESTVAAGKDAPVQ